VTERHESVEQGRSSRPVRGVLFDVDGTLYHQGRLRACMALELAAAPLTLRSVGAAAGVARILRAYRVKHEELRTRAPRDTSLADLQITDTAAGLAVSEAEVRRVVTEWMVRRPLKYLRWCRRTDLLQVLQDLRRLGVTLGVLSDYPALEKLAALGITDCFQPVLCTTDPDINALKPDPRGFWRACQLWNLSPEEVLYVGDRPDVDARGAFAAGIRCAVIRGHHRHAGDSTEWQHTTVHRLQDVCAIVRGQ
jgi:HAD superfamily hydrolase (TIGR01549 family)